MDGELNLAVASDYAPGHGRGAAPSVLAMYAHGERASAPFSN
jgi:hypothetical protein